MKKWLFILAISFFVFMPKDVFAKEYNDLALYSWQTCLNSTCSFNTFSQSTLSGVPFIRITNTGGVGTSNIRVKLNSEIKQEDSNDLSFLLYYSNVQGQNGAVPMVMYEGTMCNVVSAGYYTSLKQESNLTGWMYQNQGNGFLDVWPLLNGVLGEGNITLEPETSYVTSMYGVSCPNVNINATTSTITVYTASGSSVNGTGWYGISNSYAVSQNVKTIIEEQKEEQEKTNEKLDELNDSITNSDTSGASSSAGGFFNDFEDKDYGLSDIVTLPLTFIQGLSNASCTSLSLPIPFVDQNVELPCMSEIYEEYAGPFLTIYQIITFGLIGYWVCVNTLRLVNNFKNPDNDEVEVLDL